MRLTCLTAALLGSLTACAQDQAPEASAEGECTPQIRLDGTTYTGAGYTEVRGTRIATSAEQSECHDEGLTSEGSVFSGSSEQVAVWSVPGYSTKDVVATRFGEDSFTIFVADSLPRSKSDRVARELSSPKK